MPRVWLRYWLADDESIVAKVLHDNWGSFKSPMPGHGLRAPGLGFMPWFGCTFATCCDGGTDIGA